MYIKKVRIPTYGGRLWIIINPSIKHAIDKLEDITSESIHMKDQRGYEAYAYSGLDEKHRHRVMLFLKPNAKPGEIAHECKHAVNVIFSYRGVRLSLTNDEPECYFLDWMVTTAHKAIDGYRKVIQ